MKNWIIITIVVAAVAVSAVVLTTSVYAMTNGQVFSFMHGNGANTYGSYYNNMMSGLSPSQTGGMMNGNGMMDGQNNSYYRNQATNETNPINITTAKTNAQNYITTLNNPDFTIKQVEEYSNNFYIQVIEKSIGNGAFELVVDKYTGAVQPEMGPNMMWNQKYASQTGGMMNNGMMGLGGMMGASGCNNSNTTSTTAPLNLTQANAKAQDYLNANYAGSTTGNATIFYGYYTFEVLNNGNTYGMISVNENTGQVWYHNWHGTFITEVA